MAERSELTIDELARRTGMTVRNIRAHQSRGLLPPPEVRGRTGFYGAEPDASLIRKAERLGILRPLGDGNFEELSPRLARAGAELATLGIPAKTALDVAATLRKHADAVAKVFVELFIREVWKPFEEEGRPETRLPEVREALERLRPLASDSLLAVFQLAMSDAVEERFGRELERMQKGR